MSANPTPKPVIAVVEDDQAVLQSLAFDFEAQGYEVRLFKNAMEMLDHPGLGEIDCLVLDYTLPDINGAALLGRLRVRGVRCPAVFIASTPTARCLRDVAAADAPLIEKPLLGSELAERVRALLHR